MLQEKADEFLKQTFSTDSLDVKDGKTKAQIVSSDTTISISAKFLAADIAYHHIVSSKQGGYILSFLGQA